MGAEPTAAISEMDEELNRLEVSFYIEQTIDDVINEVREYFNTVRKELSSAKAAEVKKGKYLTTTFDKLFKVLSSMKSTLKACTSRAPGSTVLRAPSAVHADVKFVCDEHGVENIIELDKLIRSLKNRLTESEARWAENMTSMMNASISHEERVQPRRRVADSKASKEGEVRWAENMTSMRDASVPCEERVQPRRRVADSKASKEGEDSSASEGEGAKDPENSSDDNRSALQDPDYSDEERSVLVVASQEDQPEWKKELKTIQEQIALMMTQFDTLRTSLSQTQTKPLPLDVQSMDPLKLPGESFNSRREYLQTLRELPELEQFGNHVGQKLTEHMDAFHEQYPAQYWTDSQLVKFMKKSLTGVPLDLYNTCHGSFAERLQTFNKLMERESGIRKNKAIDKYEGLVMMNNNVIAYCKELETLHRYLYPTDTIEDSRQLARKLMKQTVSWRGSEIVHTWLMESQDDGIYMKIKHWALARPNTLHKQNQKHGKSEKPTTEPTNREHIATVERKPIICYECKKPGHKANACPSKTSQAEVNQIGKDGLELEKPPVETVVICDREEEALIDSGAQISVLPRWILDKWIRNGVNVGKYRKVATAKKIQVRGIVPQSQTVSEWIALPTKLLRTGKKSILQFAIIDTTIERIIVGHEAFAELGITLCFHQPKEARIDVRCVVQPHSRKDIAITGGSVEQPTLLSENRIIPDIQGVTESVASVSIYNDSDDPILLDKGEVVGVWDKCTDEVKIPLQAVQTIVSESDDEIDEQLGCQDMKDISAVLIKYKSIFGSKTDSASLMLVPPVDIEMDGTAPKSQKVRPVPIAIQKELIEQLREMEKSGIMEKSRSSWASPLVLVRKKDGSLRICVDYRIVNKAILKDRYPMPNAEVMLQRLAGCKVFSTFDCLSGFHQIPLSPTAKPITAFITPIGLYQFTRLPFGMSNSPAVFQRCIDHILNTTGLWHTEIFGYMDDLIVGTSTKERHAEVLEVLFSTLQSFGVTLRADKSQIAKTSIQFLGHILSDEGVQQDPNKTAAISQFPKPTNVSELRTFLGMTTYYRKFIMGFASIAKPLYNLTSVKQTWKWEHEHQQAFEKLKEKLITAPILRQPDVELARSGMNPFIIYTDASTTGTGAVLCQGDAVGQLHPIAYCSKTLDKHQSRYHVTDLEALAVLRALERFHCFVYGVGVIVRTDHEPLLAVVRSPAPSNRLLRWILQFRKYDLKIEYIKGSTNVVADALIRGPVTPEHPEPTDTAYVTEEAIIAPVVTNSISNWLNLLKEDEQFGSVIQQLEQNNSYVSSSPQDKVTYIISNGILYRIDQEGNQVAVVPRDFRKEIMTTLHNNDWIGHFGPKKLISTLRREYYWPGLAGDVMKWHKTCVTCYINNYSKASTPPLQPIIVTKPYETIGMDLLDLNRSRNGYRYCLTVVDYFTKWAELYPLKISDNGSEFASHQFQTFLKWFCIEWSPSEPYNPRQNGLAERTQQTIVSLLRKSDCVLADWDVRIPLVLHAYNRSTHSSTGFSPFEMLHGYQPAAMITHDWADEDEDVSLVTHSAYMNALKESLDQIHGSAKKELAKSREAQKAQYDKEHSANKTPMFKENDLVMVKKHNKQKLEQGVRGPYRILAVRKTTVILQKVDRVKEIIRATIDRLIPFPEVESPDSQGVAVFALIIECFRCTDPRFHCKEATCATTVPIKEACRGITHVPPFLQEYPLPGPIHLAKLMELIDGKYSETVITAELGKREEHVNITKDYLAVALGIHRERCMHAIQDAAKEQQDLPPIGNLSSLDVQWSVAHAVQMVKEKKRHFKHHILRNTEESRFLILPPEFKFIGIHQPTIYVMNSHEAIRRAALKIEKASSIPSLVIIAPIKDNADDYIVWLDRSQLITFILDKKIEKVTIVFPPATSSEYDNIVHAIEVECRYVTGTLLAQGIQCEMITLGPKQYDKVTLDHPQGCLGRAIALEKRPYTTNELAVMCEALKHQLMEVDVIFNVKPENQNSPSNHNPFPQRHRDEVSSGGGMWKYRRQDARRHHARPRDTQRSAGRIAKQSRR